MDDSHIYRNYVTELVRQWIFFFFFQIKYQQFVSRMEIMFDTIFNKLNKYSLRMRLWVKSP